MPMIACESCDALNKKGAQTCAECGASLSAAAWPEPAPAARRRGGRRRVAEEEHDLAREEFTRNRHSLLLVRLLFGVGALSSVLPFWIASVLVEVGGEEMASIANVMIGIGVGLLLFMVAGAVFVARKPMPWTLSAAIFWTLVGLFALRNNYYRFNAFNIALLVVALLFWGGVMIASRLGALMREYDDLQLSGKRGGKMRRRVEGGVADSARARRRLERERSRSGQLRLVGLVVGGLVLLGGGVWAATRPPSVHSAVDAFAAHWQGGDVAALGRMWPDGENGRNHDQLEEGLERRGWSQRLPALGEPVLEAGEGFAVVAFPCDGGELDVQLRLHDVRGWQLADLRLPDLTPGDLEPALAAFRAAWQAPGSDALVELFRPEARERAGRSLRRALEKRGWLEQRPAFDGMHVQDRAGARRRVQFDLDLDQVGLAFEWWHPRWYLVGFRPPR